ncbi:MAG TPA: hypothetical protein VFE53_25675 [Mucilaginibacter sp.]|jgi:hypothetical protein|nr:hypothetical protein [Mucilaginibacter sp.]
MRKFNLSIALIIGLLAASTATFAQSRFAKTHPRRHEVNSRLANQNKRIHNEVKEGDMSKKQAANLHKDDHQIRQEERDMASQNHSHITKKEQKALNQQENKTSKKIGS